MELDSKRVGWRRERGGGGGERERWREKWRERTREEGERREKGKMQRSRGEKREGVMRDEERMERQAPVLEETPKPVKANSDKETEAPREPHRHNLREERATQRKPSESEQVKTWKSRDR